MKVIAYGIIIPILMRWLARWWIGIVLVSVLDYKIVHHFFVPVEFGQLVQTHFIFIVHVLQKNMPIPMAVVGIFGRNFTSFRCQFVVTTKNVVFFGMECQDYFTIIR